MRKLYVILFLVLFFTKNVTSQSLAINTDGSTASASALLDVKSTNKGLLIPRMNKTQRHGIVSPATGLLVFQNAPDSIGFYYYDGSKWNWLAAINGNADTLAWKRNGNTGTDTAVNFIGTVDDMPLRFKINNQWAGQWDPNNGNYFIGKNAGRNSLVLLAGYGANNIAIGDSSLFKNDSGYRNIAIGTNTLYSNTLGYQNVAIGDDILTHNTTGMQNVAIGAGVLSRNTTGWGNISIGRSALTNNTTGHNNIANGYQALASNTTGLYNIASGYHALYANTTGDYNIANGRYALYANTTGNHNIANGYDALSSNTTGDYNIANGNYALYVNFSGDHNIANGFRALFGNISGQHNIANGCDALGYNNGSFNIASGYRALYRNSDGEYNLAMGDSSLAENLNGRFNIAIGTDALSANTNGNYNIAIGPNTMESFKYYNAGNNFNTYNIAIGRDALSKVNPTNATANTSGKNNIGIGAFSMQVPTTGYNNTAIGYNSEINGANYDNSTVLGANATATGSDYVRIGNTGVTSIFGAVNFNTSDGRFKTNVQPNVPGLDFIMGLRPVTYHFEKEKYSRFIGEKQDEQYTLKLQKQDAESKTSTGFIAQEVEALAKKLNYDFDGLYKPQSEKDAYGLGYQQFVTPLIKAVQEQQQLILQQQQLINQQQQAAKEQQDLLNDVLKRLAALENK